MKLEPKISPLIWWPIIIFSTSIGTASMSIAYDAVCNGQCSANIESDLGNARTLISGEGPIAASQAIQFEPDLYSSTSLVDADKGKFQIRTNEISLRSDARNLKAAAKLDYNTAQILGSPEIVEDEDGNAWLEIENRTLHHESLRLQLTGNGSLDEEVIIAVGLRNRKVFDMSQDGNFSFNQSLQLSGLEMKRSFSMLPEPDSMTETEEEAAFRATAGKVTA